MSGQAEVKYDWQLIVIKCPEVWPVESEIVLAGIKFSSVLSFKVIARTDGRIVLILLDNVTGLGISEYVTSRICFDSKCKNLLIDLGHKESHEPILNINNVQLQFTPNDIGVVSIQEINATPELVYQKIYGVTVPLALPDWVTWRTVMFSQVKRPSNWCRDKTELEQLEELFSSAVVLCDSISKLKAGQSQYAGVVLAIFRANFYWELDEKGVLKRSYDPLLLRLASYRQLKLEVYAHFYPAEMGQQFSKKWNNVFFHLPCSAYFNKPDMDLKLRKMDVQDWLLMTTIFNAYQDSKNGYVHLSVSKLFANLANKVGFSHFDRYMTKDTETLSGILASEGSLMTQFLIELADVMYHLMRKVLMSYDIKYEKLLINNYADNSNYFLQSNVFFA